MVSDLHATRQTWCSCLCVLTSDALLTTTPSWSVFWKANSDTDGKYPWSSSVSMATKCHRKTKIRDQIALKLYFLPLVVFCVYKARTWRCPDAIAPYMLSCIRQGGARNQDDSRALWGLVYNAARLYGMGVDDGVRQSNRRRHEGNLLITIDMITWSLV